MKGEVISVIDKAKEAETNLTDQHKIIAEKEREINEFRPGYECGIFILYLQLLGAKTDMQIFLKILTWLL